MNILRNLLLPCMLLHSALNINAQVAYPDHFQYNGNPLVRSHGAADPDANVCNDTVWVYCSQDHEGGYKNMDGYHVFSSTDMMNWTDHGEILNSDDVSWGIDRGGWMWAPGAVKANGKYYLYYPHRDKTNEWRLGIAISERPQGPFKDIGYPMEGIEGMDPHVFIDDDGQAYIYNNSFIVAKLKPNMIELAEPVRKINYHKFNKIKNTQTEGFAEGSYLHKRNGIYEEGTRVTLSARHDYFFEFDSWDGDIQGNENPVSIIVDSHKKVNALFNRVEEGDVVAAINCGGEAFRSKEGIVYSADKYSVGGNSYHAGGEIEDTEDDGELNLDLSVVNMRAKISGINVIRLNK